MNIKMVKQEQKQVQDFLRLVLVRMDLRAVLEKKNLVDEKGNIIIKNVIDVNPFLMTKIGIETKTGIRTIKLGNNTLTLVL